VGTEPGSLQEGHTLEQDGKTTGVQVIAPATDVLRALEAEPEPGEDRQAC
jgi:hypothetical protein